MKAGADAGAGSPLSVRRRGAAPGFTMIELITVMVIMGIVSAVAAARFFDRGTFDVRAYADQTKALIRYAQQLAIAQNRPIYVSATGARFALCSKAACDSAAVLVSAPSGGNSGNSATRSQCRLNGSYVSTWMCEALPTGIQLASSRASEAGPGGVFYFDAMGRPYNSADQARISASNEAGQPSSFTRLTLTLSSTKASIDLLVEPETGYVH